MAEHPKIHAKYANLPDSAKNSEVLSSQYAAAVIRAGAEDDQEDLVPIMEEWEAHLRGEGVTVATSIIEVLGEVTLLCKKNKKEELAGRLAEAITDLAKGVAKQYVSSTSLVEKMSSMTDMFFEGLEELKKASTGLQKLVPKLKAHTKKSTSGHPATSSATKRRRDTIKGPPASPIYGVMETDQDVYDTPTDTKKDAKGKEPMKDDTNMDMIKDEASPSSIDLSDLHTPLVHTTLPMGTEQENRDQDVELAKSHYRAHYSSPEFSAFPPEKQVSLMEYYIEFVLKVPTTIWVEHPWVYGMLTDLIDKEQATAICRGAQQGILKSAQVMEAVEDIQAAIVACSGIYGVVNTEVRMEDSTPFLYITNIK